MLLNMHYILHGLLVFFINSSTLSGVYYFFKERNLNTVLNQKELKQNKSSDPVNEHHGCRCYFFWLFPACLDQWLCLTPLSMCSRLLSAACFPGFFSQRRRHVKRKKMVEVIETRLSKLS